MGPKYSVRKTSSVGSSHTITDGRTNHPTESSVLPPASTLAPDARARSSAADSRTNARWSITAPPKLPKSATSPYVRASVVAASSSRIALVQSERGRYAREAAEHFWPWYSNAPRTSPVITAAGSADGCAITKSLPPVSPTRRGYDAYELMFAPTVDHRCWNVPVEPVKWMPASAGCGSATSLIAAPSPVTRLITPGGNPAASNNRIVWCAANCWVGDGFHTTTLPSSAGADGRFPAIAVKLNGVMASTNPSSGR
jgi:hypothetical protein